MLSDEIKERRYVLEGQGWVELQDIMGNELSIVNAARVSHLGQSKGKEADTKLLKYLWQNSHFTPFEMVELKFRVKCPVAIARQWFRHRTASYNEASRRYTKENLSFYTLPELKQQATKSKQGSASVIEDETPILSDLLALNTTWGFGNYTMPNSVKDFLLDYNMYSQLVYETLVNNGVSLEDARMVFPVALNTEFIFKMDLRNLLHFVSLRADSHAQHQIREYASAILEYYIKELFPNVYDVFIEGIN